MLTFNRIKTKSEENQTYPAVYIYDVTWDDWFKYDTTFKLVVFDNIGKRHEIGSLKIGQIDLEKGRPQFPEVFEDLDNSYFSLGQDVDYYSNLYKLDEEIRICILKVLHDVVWNESLWESVQNQEVLNISLLRSVDAINVETQFRRVIRGEAKLTPYEFDFNYVHPNSEAVTYKLNFTVKPESYPPTNIHVMIGRNGAGKTSCLQAMINSFINPKHFESKFLWKSSYNTGMISDTKPESIFANLVAVSFSAFDIFTNTSDSTARYTYIGLKSAKNEDSISQIPKDIDALAKEFVSGINACKALQRFSLLQHTIEMLESDPIFKSVDAAKTLSNYTNPQLHNFYKSLSSGHKIVLLTISKLVEVVEERTLVLMDEPEAHLHPPLLGAFTRALSYLLIHRNGVAIVATHSPAIAQEVPRSCVTKLQRTGKDVVAEHPAIETFGENVGVLTREVFGLEVDSSGFHKMLQSIAVKAQTYEEASSYFEGQLGGEARAILRQLILQKQ